MTRRLWDVGEWKIMAGLRPRSMIFIGGALNHQNNPNPALSSRPTHSLSSRTLHADGPDVPLTGRALPQRPPNSTFMLMSGVPICLCVPFNYLRCAMNALVIYQNVTQRDTFTPSIWVTSILDITAHAYASLMVVFFVLAIVLIPPCYPRPKLECGSFPDRGGVCCVEGRARGDGEHGQGGGWVAYCRTCAADGDGGSCEVVCQPEGVSSVARDLCP